MAAQSTPQRLQIQRADALMTNPRYSVTDESRGATILKNKGPVDTVACGPPGLPRPNAHPAARPNGHGDHFHTSASTYSGGTPSPAWAKVQPKFRPTARCG